MSNNNSNPLQDGVLVVVFLVAIGGGITKCASEAWDSAAIAAESFFTLIGHGLMYYLIPFAVGTCIVTFCLRLLCTYGRTGAIHSADYTNLGAGIPVFCALGLFIFGIPNVKEPWTYSFWAAIIFGGPFLTFYLGKPHHMSEDEEHEKLLVTPLNEVIDTLERKLSNAEWSDRESSRELRAIRAEMAKMKEEEKSKAEKTAEETKKKGVLDSSDF